jgi:hypothetical protein
VIRVKQVSKRMYASRNHAALPRSPHCGTHHSMVKVTASGRAPNRKKGRRRPQRVLTRSTSAPMSGSFTASQMPPTSSTSPEYWSGRRAMSERKNAKKKMKIVEVAEPPQSPSP